MSRSVLSLMVAVTAAAVFLGSGSRLHSQEAEIVVIKKSPQEQLLALKMANAVLLEKQQKTLQRIDELKLLADQLRIMTKRG